MNQFTHYWGDFVVRQRWTIMLATLVLMLLAPLSFKNIYYDNSNEAYFIENDPNLVAFDNLLERFGDTEYLVVGVPARNSDADVFSASTISMIAELTEFFEDHEFVTQVRSLSKYQYTHDDGGILATDDLFEDIEELAADPDLLDAARNIMAGEKLALDSLITEDFQHTRISARVAYIKNENAHNVTLVTDLINFIDEKGYAEQGFELRLSGSPVVGERFETLTLGDQAWINPVMGTIMFIILFVVFRSIFATFVPLIVIGATMLFVTSVQGMFSWPTTAVNSALIPTMIVLCMGASVHVLVEFFQARREGKAPKKAAAETTSDLLFPILFTSLTTSVGFIALSVTELRPVREFAVLAAIGPMIIFLLTTTTLPAVLSFSSWLPRNEKNLNGQQPNTFLHRIINRIPRFSQMNKKVIATVGIGISVFSLYGVSYIKVDTNIVNYFKDSSWVNQDLLYFNEHFKGISNLEVVVNTGEAGGVKNPDVLKRADAFQAWLESKPETGNAISVMDFYRQINQALNEDNPEYFELPDSRNMAAQFLLLYENSSPDEDLSDLKDFDEQFLRISVPVINMDETQTTQFIEEINQGIQHQFSDLNLELTGSLVMSNAQNVYTNNGMFQSFSIAILVIGICFLVLFKSLKYGVIALVPSIVPILLTGAIVSLIGIPMDLGTMIVGAMTIGIAVDDAIHLMSRYLLRRKRGDDVYNAINGAVQSSGKAVILTSIILVSGFSVMLLGSFIPFIYVGLFSVMIMSFALLGDLIFMPAILYLTDSEKTSVSRLEKGASNNV